MLTTPSVNAKQAYVDSGFCQFDGILPEALLDDYTASYFACLRMQAMKLGRRDLLDAAPSVDKLNDLVTALNAADPDALSEAGVMARSTGAGLAIAASPVVREICADLLDCPPELLIVSGPSLFVNIPSLQARLYTWHAEMNWYPKRRNFVNLWLPVNEAKVATNGTMSVLPGSHRESWLYFSEYHGYGKGSEGDAKLNLQYEIPDSELAGYQPKPIEARPGDVVAFAASCVHRSNENQSGLPSYALTIRVFDYRRDLTISSDWAERPYRDAATRKGGGRGGLRPGVEGA